MGRLTVRRSVLRIGPSGALRQPDTLAVEEPLELRIGGRALTVTMRTPGADIEFAHGFLLTEGMITTATDVLTARYCNSRDATGHHTYNVLDVALADHVPASHPGVERHFTSTSSCGVCGKSSLEAVRTRTAFPPQEDRVAVSPGTLARLPDRLRATQRVFHSTGGLHAAGLFDADGSLLVTREDVGRHNAVDKVLGWALLGGRIPAVGCVLMVSGRVSFELVQKAAMAGVPVLAAVSAPSSLAVEQAEDAGITLVGFLRGSTMNVYAHAGRVRTRDRAAPNRPGAVEAGSGS